MTEEAQGAKANNLFSWWWEASAVSEEDISLVS